MTHLTNDQAERVIAAAKRKATEIGISVSIAVQDHGGHIIAFSRMDDAFLGSIDIAEKKASTAIFFRIETQELWEHARANGPAHGIELTNGVSITYAGGIPLRGPNRALIGGIGVSGGSVDQDYAVAQAGAAALPAE